MGFATVEQEADGGFKVRRYDYATAQPLAATTFPCRRLAGVYRCTQARCLMLSRR